MDRVGYSLASATPPRVSRSRRAPAAGCRVRKTERGEASRRARKRDGEHAAPACLILESEPLIRNPGSQSRARRRYKPFAGHGYDGRRPGPATRRRGAHSTPRHVTPRANKSASTRSDTGRSSSLLRSPRSIAPGSSFLDHPSMFPRYLDHAGSCTREDPSWTKSSLWKSSLPGNFSSALGESLLI